MLDDNRRSGITVAQQKGQQLQFQEIQQSKEQHGKDKIFMALDAAKQ